MRAETVVSGDLAKRAQDYLAAAILCFVCGLLLSLGLGAYTVISSGVGVNFRGEPIPSGYRYVPGQISFLCRDPSSPEGMCFRASLAVGGICLLVSGYTWELGNVRLAGWRGSPRAEPCDDRAASLLEQHGTPGLAEQKSLRRFLAARHLVPALSLLLVVLVHLPFDQPDAESTPGNALQNGVHSAAAVALFVGYPCFELCSLHYGVFELRLADRERSLRLFFARASLACFVGFMIPYNMAIQAKAIGICCEDAWRVPTLGDAAVAKANGHLGIMVADYTHNETGIKMLFDTATGAVRFCKLAALGFEVLDFVCLGGSLLTIWFFARG